jgi:hypothetical protein
MRHNAFVFPVNTLVWKAGIQSLSRPPVAGVTTSSPLSRGKQVGETENEYYETTNKIIPSLLP